MAGNDSDDTNPFHSDDDDVVWMVSDGVEYIAPTYSGCSKCPNQEKLPCFVISMKDRLAGYKRKYPMYSEVIPPGVSSSHRPDRMTRRTNMVKASVEKDVGFVGPSLPKSGPMEHERIERHQHRGRTQLPPGEVVRVEEESEVEEDSEVVLETDMEEDSKEEEETAEVEKVAEIKRASAVNKKSEEEEGKTDEEQFEEGETEEEEEEGSAEVEEISKEKQASEFSKVSGYNEELELEEEELEVRIESKFSMETEWEDNESLTYDTASEMFSQDTKEIYDISSGSETP